MRKKLILFLMLALFGSTSFLRADVVQIGEGTGDTQYLPSYAFYKNSLTQQIYTAEEIGVGAGTINSIAFFNNGTEKTRTYDVYFVNTTKASFDSTSDWIAVTEADKVFTGAVTLVAGDWTTITLSTPFAYNGTNLAVIVDDGTGSYSSGMKCYSFPASSQSIYAYSDTVDYDPTNPSTYTANSVGTVKNQIILDITVSSGPTPPTPPTGEFSLTPDSIFDLGERPLNGWMEPFTVRMYNGGVGAIVSASVSNTSEQEPFIMSRVIDNYYLANEAALEFNMKWNANAPEGVYNEEFTLFYAENDRNIITIPVTAELYTAEVPDIVEKKKSIGLSYTGGVATYTHRPTNLHANYLLQGMTEMKPDAVYRFNLAHDSKVSVTAGDEVIAIYKYVAPFRPTTATEPVAIVYNGQMTDQLLLSDTYWMIVASDNITSVELTAEQLPAPEEITNLAPADGAAELDGTIELSWEGGENATYYRVLFGTSPTNIPVAMDWTPVDNNYGTFDVTDYVSPNTQYFWQIEVKNSEGTVTGPRWGFTTALITPSNVTASEEKIFIDETTLIKWKLAGTGGFTGSITVADGTETSSTVPVYGLWMDYYTRGEMIYPAEMLEEMEGGDITSMEFYISSAATGAWTGDQFHVYLMEVDATTLSSYYTATNATIVYTGALDGQGETMNIVFDEPYNYGGGNLLVGIEEFEKGTWKSCSFYGVTATGASASGYNSSALSGVTFNQRDFLPKVTFHCGDERNINLAKGNRDLLGFNVYYGDVKANTELITDTKYVLGNLPYNVNPGHNVTVTAVYHEGESELSAPVVVKVSGYGTLTGTVTELISGAPLAGVAVSFYGMDEFNNVVSYNATTNASGVYTIENVKAGVYNIATATLEGMENSNMANPATVAFEGTTTVDFVMHEVYKPVFKVVAQELEPATAKVMWSLDDFVGPTPGGVNPGGGGTVSTQTFDFDDSSFQGWTTIDGGSPTGYGWQIGSTKIGQTGSGHDGSTDFVLSQSYDNSYGVVYPNNFLICPTKGRYTSVSLWACGQDASYAAEHFGIAVSTTGNTSASDFVMVQEWTVGSKGEAYQGPRGQRAQSTWTQYTADLSAYAGQDIWVAVRHFNCSDMFYLDVDDIELSCGSKGDRSVQEYAVYRKAIQKETAITDADSVFFGTTTDTLYADFDWNNVEPGLYQYGVSAIYPSTRGNRGEIVIDFETGDFSQFPTAPVMGPSYPWTVVDGGHSGKGMKSSNGGSASSTSQIEATVTMPTDGTISFWALCMGEGTSTIWDKCIFELDGTQQFCYGANQPGWNEYSYEVAAGEHTLTWKYSKDGSVNPTGDYMMVDDIVLSYAGGEVSNDDPNTPITWSNILPKDITTYVKVEAVLPIGTAEGTEVRFHNTFEITDDIVAILDETGFVEWPDFRKGEYTLNVDLEGYTCEYENTPVSIWGDTVYTVIMQEIYKPVDAVTASRMGYLSWDAVIPEERVPEKYIVTLDGLQIAETTDNFYQIEEELTVGQTYTAGVAVLYTTGISIAKTADFTYADCNSAAHQVDTVHAGNVIDDTNVTLTWDGSNPNPGPNPPGPQPGPGDTYDFDDSSFQGWTTIDGGSPSGYGWQIGSGKIGQTGSGHNGSTDFVLSQSYDNNYGVVYPNNFLICPTKAQYTSVSLWACGQDASYAAEHFGIAVSTTGNTSASDFVMVQEWTVGSKGEAYQGPRGQRAQSTWTEYTADLSAYAGQEIWVAVRHFNCSDMFYLDVDDITLTVPSKELEAGTLATLGQGFGQINQSMTDDGNWYYYDNGTNVDAIGLTSGGSFYWGVMFPAGTYEGNRLTKIAYFDYSAHTGTVLIYQGGTSAPGTQVYSQAYSVSGTSQYIEIEMDEPVELDDTQNVWVVMHNNNGQYVAAIDGSAGVNYGSCLSTNGSTWYTMVNQAASTIDGNWNLRAYIESGSGPAPSGLVPNKYNIFFDGELVGATSNMTFTYDAGDFNEHNYTVIWVDSDYLESCVVEGVNSINYTANHTDGVNENSIYSAIYPNPTNGDIRINANNMVRISVVNSLGQVVYNKAVEGDEAIVNMAQFGNGVYMVNIATENGTVVKRVIVSK